MPQCPECGAEFTRRGPHQTFCCAAHKTAFYNLQSKRGVIMGPLLIAWRLGKNGRTENSAYAYKVLCGLIDNWCGEDRLAGRRSDLIVTWRRERAWSPNDLETTVRARTPAGTKRLLEAENGKVTT